MWPCHQSWCVIGHYAAITASFDEHGHIRTAHLSRTALRHTQPEYIFNISRA